MLKFLETYWIDKCNVEIKLSKFEINEIKRRFDKYNIRLVAFALLCYAKKFADKNGVFTLSLCGLSGWLGIYNSNLSVYIKELVDFGFVEKERSYGLYSVRRNKFYSKSMILRIKISFDDNFDFTFYDKEIRKEFEKIFNYDWKHIVII